LTPAALTSLPVGAAQLRVAEQRFDRSAFDSANVSATDTGQVTGKSNSDGHAAFLFIFNKSAQFCFGRARRPGDRLVWGELDWQLPTLSIQGRVACTRDHPSMPK
jgi:hypothetical protein